MRTAFPAVSAFALTLAALSGGVGCRASMSPAVPAVSGEKVPDNADTVAQEAVDAKVTMLLHLDRLQGFRFSKRLIVLGGWDEAIAGTGVDPLNDVHRAFIAAHASHTGDVAIILQHSAPEDHIAAALAALQKEWLAKHPPPRPRPPEPVPSQVKKAQSPAGAAARPESAPMVQGASPAATAAGKPASAPANQGASSAATAAATPTHQGASPAPSAGDRRRTDSIRPHPEITLDDEPEPNGSGGAAASDPDPEGSTDGRTYPVRLADLEARIEVQLGDPAALPDLSRFPFPAAYRYMKNDFAHIDGPALIAAPHPGILVVLPPSRAFAALRLMEAGGLPAPSDAEAMVFRAWDPQTSIQNGPPWSPEVRYAEAVFSFDGYGNSSLKFRAVCTSPEAAKTQAERMTSQVEDAQTISLGSAKLRLFDYIEFHAERDRVKMTTRLLADDVDWLVAMSMKPL